MIEFRGQGGNVRRQRAENRGQRMIENCTGVILAGGVNRRLPGKKKTFHRVGDRMILDTIYAAFSGLFAEIIIVVNDPLDFVNWDLVVARDIIPTRNALAGLHAGLFYASNDYIYVTACDTPFISKPVIRYLAGQIAAGVDVVIPQTDDGMEPLSAVYSKTCLPLIEKNLEQHVYMIKKFFKNGKIRAVPADILRALDPELNFVFNVNTPEDLETARKKTAGQSA